MQKGWRLKIATELKDQDRVFLKYCEDLRLKLYTIQWAMTQAPVPTSWAKRAAGSSWRRIGYCQKKAIEGSTCQNAVQTAQSQTSQAPVLDQSKMRDMPLTYDAYAEAKEKEQEKDSQLMTTQEQMALIMAYLMEKDPEKKAEISRDPIEITC
jgi:hypothetical protein